MHGKHSYSSLWLLHALLSAFLTEMDADLMVHDEDLVFSCHFWRDSYYIYHQKYRKSPQTARVRLCSYWCGPHMTGTVVIKMLLQGTFFMAPARVFGRDNRKNSNVILNNSPRDVERAIVRLQRLRDGRYLPGQSHSKISMISTIRINFGEIVVLHGRQHCAAIRVCEYFES